MTQDETIENNKLIAEFMKLPVSELHGELCYADWDGMHSVKYHTSWDWLMPVVEKIESTETEFDGYFGVHISSNNCCIQGTRLRTDPEHFHPAYFNDVTLDTKILSTWQAVIQFLKWYNTNKPNTP